MATPIPEVRVKAKKRRPGGADDYILIEIERQMRESGYMSGPGQVAPVAGFVAPALAPAIEEIIVTAPRPTAPPVATPNWAAGLSRSGFALAIAGVIGYTAKEILDDLGEQQLERAYRELIATPATPKPDTPVIVEQPKPIPEVTVTAKRPFPQVAPAPIFFPGRYDDVDPWTMQPVVPRVSPQIRPDVKIDTEITTPTAPQVAPAPPAVLPAPSPFVAPTTAPQTQVRPSLRPEIQTQPWVDPLTQVNPTVQPSVSPSVRPSTSTRTRTRTRSAVDPWAMPQTQPATRTTQCPPCVKTKKRDKARDRCYKKLVKEGLYESWDESYNWVEIDCLTGRVV